MCVYIYTLTRTYTYSKEKQMKEQRVKNKTNNLKKCVYENVYT